MAFTSLFLASTIAGATASFGFLFRDFSVLSAFLCYMTIGLSVMAACLTEAWFDTSERDSDLSA